MRIASLTLVLCLALAACGEKPKPADDHAAKGATSAVPASNLPTGPVHAGIGVIASVEGTTVTLDHEAVQGGLPAGRNAFTGDATVFADAPLDPGARVAFSYQDWTPRPLLTELKAR